MISATDQEPSIRVAFRAWALAWFIALMYHGTLPIRAEAWLIISPEVTEIMAKEQVGRTTLDLSARERRPGRPKINPLSYDKQLRINKRSQLKRDKVRGPKRVELRLNTEAAEALNELAESRNMNRDELIEKMLIQ